MTTQPPSHRRSRRPYYIAVAVAAAAGLTLTSVNLLTQGDDAHAAGSKAEQAPQKGGTDNAADLNNDGHPDEVFPLAGKKSHYIGVVYGSKKGLNPKHHVLLSSKHLGIREGSPIQLGTGPHGQPPIGDLDDDGHPDIVADSGRAIAWGGKQGPASDGPVAHPELPGQAPDYDNYGQGVVAGDFNADGHTDLATIRQGEPGNHGKDDKIVVLSGPFKRDGTPAQTNEVNNPMPEEDHLDHLSAGQADDDEGTDLVAQQQGPDGGMKLLSGGAKTPSGVSSEARDIGFGNDVVFGDFDGDKRRDIAVGDPRRTEDPDAPRHDKGRVHVYYGKAPEKDHEIVSPKKGDSFGYQLNPVDFDGDGKDDLAVNRGSDSSTAEKWRVDVLHGSAKGLGSKTWWSGKRGTKKHGALTYNAGDYDGDGVGEQVQISGESRQYDTQSYHFWYTDGRDETLAKFSTKSLGAK